MRLLRSGGAAGFGVGPIVVARTARRVGGRIAIPGERTTAALLLHLLRAIQHRADAVRNGIEQAVLSGDVDCGVLIHEGRFTYEAKGLTLLEDLGAVWETRMKCPLPLAAIAIRRDLAARGAEDGPGATPRASNTRSRTLRRAATMSLSTPRKWMPPWWRNTSLHVNDYTIKLDERAVLALLDWQREQGLSSALPSSAPVFV